MSSTDSSALLFQFADEASAADASETLQEFGYDPVAHEGGRLHIHLEGSDLTSALEIALSHGGELVEQQPMESTALTGSAYGIDGIPIPAHTVNEDWTEAYAAGNSSYEDQPEGLSNWDDDAPNEDDYRPDDGSYDYISGDVHI